jgi:hypothetical protein
VLHNLAIGRGFQSFVHTPESGLTDRRLVHVSASDKHLIPSLRAASLLEAPATICAKTACSRGVSVASFAYWCAAASEVSLTCSNEWRPSASWVSIFPRTIAKRCCQLMSARRIED